MNTNRNYLFSRCLRQKKKKNPLSPQPYKAKYDILVYGFYISEFVSYDGKFVPGRDPRKWLKFGFL